jgi:hypothetical protein
MTLPDNPIASLRGINRCRRSAVFAASRRPRILVATSFAAITVLSLAVGAPAASTVQLRNVQTPDVTSISNGDTSLAVVVMGRNDGHNDLFPQLFSSTLKAPRWTLATPQGVADNGGVFIGAGVDGDVLAGIGPSQDLAFSPLAYSANSGRSWVSGGLEAGLARVPSAIAIGPAQSAAVLVATGGSRTVLKRTGSLEQWSPLVTAKALAALEPNCGLTSLNAVDITTNGHYLLGASCERSGTIGVFENVGGHWTAATASVPSGLAGAAFETIRLTTNGSVTDAIFAARSSKSTQIVAGWSTGASGKWTLSPSLGLDAASDVVASGAGPGDAEFALIRSGTKLVASLIDGPTGAWQRIASLPSGTQTVALEPDGTLDALVVHISALTIWHQQHVGSSFTKSQTINVPIQYGSSS